MKKIFFLVTITCCFVLYSCKDKESDRFELLTEPVWVPVSLLANGVDATGTGGILEGFLGDAKFNTDGSGTFGTYTGTWEFSITEEKLILTTPALPFTITLDILELTSTSLKLEGSVPDLKNLTGPPINIQMTFAPK